MMHPDAGRGAPQAGRPTDLVVVRVQPTVCGRWEVQPDRCGGIKCHTLDEARRIGYPVVAHARPCELIVPDAYHRVVEHERIDGCRSEFIGEKPDCSIKGGLISANGACGDR